MNCQHFKFTSIIENQGAINEQWAGMKSAMINLGHVWTE